MPTICLRQLLQLLDRGIADGAQAGGLMGDAAFEEIAHIASVAEITVLVLHRLVELLLQEGIGIGIEFVPIFVRTHQIDLVQFFARVIGEVDEAGEA